MVSIIIVTHNSENVLDLCLQSVDKQTVKASRVTIVDMASNCTKYITKHQCVPHIDVILNKRNLGYCVGNNIATERAVVDSRYILFLNPDAFLSPSFLEKALQFMEKAKEKNTGILSGKILKYNLSSKEATQILDSAGIFQTWYGKWFDRGQGQYDHGQFDTDNTGSVVPAVCGALMLCRTDALIAAKLDDGEYFRESFFMYKDDIDLSLRVRKAGYRVKYNSNLLAWHCRGWQKRSRMSKNAKLLSASNELVINRELSLIKYSYSLTKLALVKLGL